MAWATKCDRCGKYFDDQNDESNGFTFLNFNRLRNDYEIDGEEYDLCPECVVSLQNWFERKDFV